MQKITIENPSDAGQRLDRFLKKYLPNAPLGGIYKMLRTGKIKVNGKKKDQTYKISEGDEIFLWLSDEEISGLMNSDSGIVTGANLPEATPHVSGLEIRNLILYEDEFLMVVNKPPGLSVHAGDHKTKESNLIDQVQDYLGGKYDSLTFRPALVHRIDRDTSGCVLIAKDKHTLESLLQQLQGHTIEKVYHALVVGVPPNSQGTIRVRLLRIENARDEAKVRVDEEGQSAITHYRVVNSEKVKMKSNSVISIGTNAMSRVEKPVLGTKTKNHKPETFSLLECRIETGRTHQIRVHLAHIGYPILGDKAYGNKSTNSYMRRHFGITRQLLHAYSLGFTHPKTKKPTTVYAPYLGDFQKILDGIK